VPDYFGFHVQNGTNGGVVALVDWKTNLPNANAFTNISFNYPSMTSANGTWTLNFSDNTHGSIVAPDNSVNNFTLPDFASDPSYTANFNPGTSVVQFGVAKNGNITNNSQTTTVTSVLVTNSLGMLLNDGFSGPGLTANYAWQVCIYYLDSGTRAVWQPFGTAYWLKWNTTASGWGVQSSASITSGWTMTRRIQCASNRPCSLVSGRWRTKLFDAPAKATRTPSTAWFAPASEPFTWRRSPS